jgi:uncharacterized damage-inducible protein DinB
MLIETLRVLFQRDLLKLKSEIESYSLEGNLWLTSANITNSGGNLCLHLLGNLNTFIGAELGKSNYVRKRNLEFSLKNVARTILVAQIEQTTTMVDETLNNISEEDLKLEYPILVFEERMSSGYFLTHLATHLTYHLGQINYHRRLLDK